MSDAIEGPLLQVCRASGVVRTTNSPTPLAREIRNMHALYSDALASI